MSARASHRPSRRERGFTLLEVLLALGLGVLVSSVTSRVVAQTADTRDELARRTSRVTDARAALWTLRDDLASHRPGTLRIERASVDGQPILSLERDAPNPQRLLYRVRAGRLERVTRDRFRVAGRARRSVLTTGVRRLDVVALGDDGWQEVWSALRPPRGLTVTLDCTGAPRLTVAVVPLLGGTT